MANKNSESSHLYLILDLNGNTFIILSFDMLLAFGFENRYARVCVYSCILIPKQYINNLHGKCSNGEKSK